MFGKEVNFEWKGGLAIGGGGAIHGTQLEKRGKMVMHIMNGLDIAAAALHKGENIPQEAINEVSKPMIPPKFYSMMGNIGWRYRARKEGARGKLKEKPYQ